MKNCLVVLAVLIACFVVACFLFFAINTNFGHGFEGGSSFTSIPLSTPPPRSPSPPSSPAKTSRSTSAASCPITPARSPSRSSCAAASTSTPIPAAMHATNVTYPPPKGLIHPGTLEWDLRMLPWRPDKIEGTGITGPPAICSIRCLSRSSAVKSFRSSPVRKKLPTRPTISPRLPPTIPPPTRTRAKAGANGFPASFSKNKARCPLSRRKHPKR